MGLWVVDNITMNTITIMTMGFYYNDHGLQNSMGLFNDGYVIELHDNDHGLMMMVMLFMDFADLFSQLNF